MAESRSGRLEGSLTYVADLTIEVSDARGSTRIRVGDDPSGFVVDVDDPAVAVRCLPGRSVIGDLPVTVPRDLFAGTNVRLTSRGRDLGRARLTDRGRVRFAPTPAGAVVLGRAAGSTLEGPQRSWLIASVVAVVTALVVWVRRKRA